MRGMQARQALKNFPPLRCRVAAHLLQALMPLQPVDAEAGVGIIAAVKQRHQLEKSLP